MNKKSVSLVCASYVSSAVMADDAVGMFRVDMTNEAAAIAFPFVPLGSGMLSDCLSGAFVGDGIVADRVYRIPANNWRGKPLSEEIADGAAELRAVRYRFQGRERSAATGLANFRMRWYDAVTGRWLSKDPIGLSGGLNLYAFCGNDPINSTDAIGLCEGDDDEPTGPFAGVRPIILNGDEVYPGHKFNYRPDPFGHGRFPDGSSIQPHIDQLPKKGPEKVKVRFDLNGCPLKGKKGFISKRDYQAYLEAVKDVLKAIGAGASSVGTRLISVPIILCPLPMVYPVTTKDGGLVL